MANELEHILENSDKAELLEDLRKVLEADNQKVVMVCLVGTREKWSSQVLMLGVDTTYEGLGILEIGKEHILSMDESGFGECNDKEGQERNKD
jgi:hypothetical protein